MASNCRLPTSYNILCQPNEKWNGNHYYGENDEHVCYSPVKWYSQHVACVFEMNKKQLW